VDQHIITDLINALPGNSSVNTVQHATIEEAVFSMSSTPNNGVVQPVSKQRLCKHTSAKSVISATVWTVFSVESVQSAYKRSECNDSSFSGSYESVVSWRSELRRIFSSGVPE
jgi:hypothetical protein